MAKSGGGKKPAKAKAGKAAAKSAEAAQRKALGSKSYLLGPQSDGATVIRIPSDFDVMVLRKAVEKQAKNAAAAVGTVSALGDGDDQFIDAIRTSLDRLVQIINRSRAPSNQIAGTPIGDEINKKEKERSDEPASDAKEIVWADAIPRPRAEVDDQVEMADGATAPITAVLGFVGEGLSGSESDEELAKLRDAREDKTLQGVFKAVVLGKTVTLKLHSAAPIVWRLSDAKYKNTR